MPAVSWPRSRRILDRPVHVVNRWAAAFASGYHRRVMTVSRVAQLGSLDPTAGARLHRSRWWEWAAIIVLYTALRAPLVPVPLERDEGAFAAVGSAILAGEIPYRDVFDHKPPGTYYAYALGLAVVPPTVAGVHGFLLVWNLATLLCLASLATALAGPRAGVWSALAFSVVSIAGAVQGFSATSEMLLLLPLAASLRLSMAGAASGRIAFFVLAGALGALACSIKQPAALPLAASVVLLHERLPRRQFVRAAGLWLLGGIAVTATVIAYFLVACDARELWYWTVEHNRLYAALPVTNAGARAWAGFTNLAREVPFLILAAILGIVYGLRTRRPGARFAAAFLALSMASVFQSRFLYLHYFALLAPALALASGLALAWGEAVFGPRHRWAYGAMAVALTLAPLAPQSWYWLSPDRGEVITRLLGAQGADASAMLADYIRTHSRRGDEIFVYGSEPQIGFLSGRRDVNPFVTVYPLTWTWPRHREFQERAWHAIERARPAFIVVSRLRNSLVRSPEVDPYLERRLVEFVRRDYHFALVVVSDANTTWISPRPPEAGSAEPLVLAELWRRADLIEMPQQESDSARGSDASAH